MPFLIAVAAAIAGVLYWMYRARMAGQVASELADAASDVLNAARRFGFRRRANIHPVEAVERPDLTIAALAVAFVELDGLPSAEQKKGIAGSISRETGVTLSEADEMLILGHWLVGQCNGAQPAVERLTKRLYKLQGAAGLEPLMRVLNDVALLGGGALSPQQKEALADIARHMRVR